LNQEKKSIEIGILSASCHSCVLYGLRAPTPQPAYPYLLATVIWSTQVTMRYRILGESEDRGWLPEEQHLPVLWFDKCKSCGEHAVKLFDSGKLRAWSCSHTIDWHFYCQGRCLRTSCQTISMKLRYV